MEIDKLLQMGEELTEEQNPVDKILDVIVTEFQVGYDLYCQNSSAFDLHDINVLDEIIERGKNIAETASTAKNIIQSYSWDTEQTEEQVEV